MDELKVDKPVQEDTKDELKGEITDRFKYAKDHYEDWKTEAQQDYDFALGDQWEDDDRQTLKDQGRPCLTFNRIKPIINIVSGYQRENAPRIKANPEGGEDKIFSEFCDRLMAKMDKWSHLNYQLGYLFDDGCYCGKGVLEAIITYDKDPIRGEIKFIMNEPWQILPDPDCRDYNWNEGAGYVFKYVRLTKDKLKQLFPNKKSEIDGFEEDTDDTVANSGGVLKEGPSNDYDNDKSTTVVGTQSDDEDESDFEGDEKFTLKEYWRKKFVSRYFVMDVQSGEPKKFKTKEEADTFAGQQGPGIKVITRTVPEMWVASYVCGYILQDVVSPLEPFYSGYPFFPYVADWAPNAKSEKLRVQGITRQLKDPQREKNKSKSQNLHILNTQANSGWIIDDNALTPAGKADLENAGSKPGIIIYKRPGSEVREILPKAPNPGNLQREAAADEEFKQIATVNPDLMGLQDGSSASGKAMGMRIRQSVLALSRMFTNYRYTKEIIGGFMLAMIPMMFDVKKAVKVMGTQWMMSFGLDQMTGQPLMDEGKIAAFLTMIGDSKYDIVITESGGMTLRYETFEKLTEMAQAGMPIPPDLVLEYTDIPNTEEVKQRINAYAQQQQQAAMMAKGMPGPGTPAQPGV